ncbi:MAG: outer membrane beta-barrel protein [Mesorhizobium sp.]|nr:outer membrane beta-barrel protein [Mesorhizobium sp.]
MSIFSGAAFAADEVAEAPTGYNWTGFYIGLGGGAGAVNHTISVPPLFSFSGIGGEGIFGELTVGYDHMLSDRMLLGVFADGRMGNIQTSLNIGPFGADITADHGFDVGLRAGYLITPRTLAYVLAGYSWQHFDVSATGFGSVYDWNGGGFVIGKGFETAITGNLTMKAEYRYAQYGAEDVFDAGFLFVKPATHTFHAGLNYRFGASNGGGAAWDTPDYDWTGLKIGGSFGSGALVHDISIPPLAGFGFNGIGAEGFFGEVSVGYDWEFGNDWVVGVLADGRYSSIATELNILGGLFNAAIDADYGFDVLGRVGKKIDGATLVYATAGYAWQHFDINASGIGSIYDWGASGFVVGAGVEAALSERTAINLEYRYTGYQGEDFGFPGFVDVSPSSHTVRAGFKFKLF